MKSALSCAVSALCACGRIGFDVTGGTADARDNDTVDAVPLACQGRQFAQPAAASFSDDFSTGVLTDRWMPIASCIVQQGGELIATPAPASMDYCFAFTVKEFHLACSQIEFVVAEFTTPALGPQTFLYIDNNTLQRRVQLLLEGNTFSIGEQNSLMGAGTTAGERRWRIRETGEELVFSTSSDGIAWLERARFATPFSLDNVDFSLGAGTWQAVADPGRARFRCFNVPPPCN